VLSAQFHFFSQKRRISLFQPLLIMHTVLTIAGFDPSSGAGVTADLMVFAAHGLYGTACITALTVQSTLGVRSTHPTEASLVSETLECLQADLPPEGIKIGMLANSDNTHRICDYLEIFKTRDEVTKDRFPVVLDPVLRSSSGKELLDQAAVAVVCDRLLPLVDWITPNTEELAVLSGRPVVTRYEIVSACQALQSSVSRHSMGSPLGIIATGGHLEKPDDFVLLPDGEHLWLSGERVETQSTHGTGCAFSSAFLSRLVLGDSPAEAARAAKLYVAGALKTAIRRGAGCGPMNHLWPLGVPQR
jgi:hydroxymethylpyrimidine/phosphomethylpyrimidine kinase